MKLSQLQETYHITSEKESAILRELLEQRRVIPYAKAGDDFVFDAEDAPILLDAWQASNKSATRHHAVAPEQPCSAAEEYARREARNKQEAAIRHAAEGPQPKGLTPEEAAALIGFLKGTGKVLLCIGSIVFGIGTFIVSTMLMFIFATCVSASRRR